MFEMKIYINQFTVLFEQGHSLNGLIEIGESYPQAVEFIICLQGVEVYRHVNGDNYGRS